MNKDNHYTLDDVIITKKLVSTIIVLEEDECVFTRAIPFDTFPWTEEIFYEKEGTQKVLSAYPAPPGTYAIYGKIKGLVLDEVPEPFVVGYENDNNPLELVGVTDSENAEDEYFGRFEYKKKSLNDWKNEYLEYFEDVFLKNQILIDGYN